jgi:hypothetical protein
VEVAGLQGYFKAPRSTPADDQLQLDVLQGKERYLPASARFILPKQHSGSLPIKGFCSDLAAYPPLEIQKE